MKNSTLIAELNRIFKKEVVFPASDERFRITRISTGSLVLDQVLGGGIAKGRFTEFYGPYSALKTYTALRTIANAQRAGLKCLFADAEHSFDPKWAGKLGVDLGSLTVYTPDFGEELIDVVEAFLRSREYGVVVIDSIAALIPKPEIDASASKEQMGLQGRMTSKMMRRLTAALDNTTAVILINQVREKIGVVWGKPETTTGGRAIPFYAGQRLEMRRGEKIKKTIQGKDKVVGYVVNIRVEKDKTGPNVEKVASVEFLLGKGIDPVDELVQLGERAGLVTKRANSYIYHNVSVVGRDAFKRRLVKDKSLRLTLRKDVNDAISNNAV